MRTGVKLVWTVSFIIILIGGGGYILSLFPVWVQAGTALGMVVSFFWDKGLR